MRMKVYQSKPRITLSPAIRDGQKYVEGRLMKKNDWQLKDGEYHLTVLGVIERPDGKFLITQRSRLTRAFRKCRISGLHRYHS